MNLNRCECGEVFETPKDRLDFQYAPCPECGELANRVTKRPPPFFVKGQFDAYESPITGEVITTMKQRNQEMKKHGCVDYEPTLRKDIDANLKREEDKLEKMVDETVDYEIANMDSRKRERLENELTQGADVSYERLGE